MIAKGNQRSGGQQLATHLLNAHDNERVEVAEIYGSIAQDLHGAFKEWRATADGTQCKKFLYSLSVNPNPADGPLTREQYYDFIARVEEKHGLTGQARAVVFHVKEGREHCHVVWSRIDLEQMKAVQMSHDRQKLRAVVQEFAREHGLTLPKGMTNNRGLSRFNEHAKGVSLGEKQQEERTGLTKEERRKEITDAWQRSYSGKSFVQALKNKGYILAKGDRRAYVVVDRFGEIHSLARQIEGAKTKDVKTRLAEFPLENPPDAVKIQEQRREQAKTKSQKHFSEEFKRQADKRWEMLKRKQHNRREALNQKRQTMVERHQKEQQRLREAQEKEVTARTEKRKQTKAKGLKAFLGKVTGISALLRKKHKQQDQAFSQKHQNARKALKSRQNRQAQDMNRRFRALASMDRRESQSLKTSLQRRQYKNLTREFRQKAGQKRPSTHEQQLEDIKTTGKDITKPQTAEEAKAQDSLAEAFRRAEKQKQKREQTKDRDDPGRTLSR